MAWVPFQKLWKERKKERKTKNIKSKKVIQTEKKGRQKMQVRKKQKRIKKRVKEKERKRKKVTFCANLFVQLDVS